MRSEPRRVRSRYGARSEISLQGRGIEPRRCSTFGAHRRASGLRTRAPRRYQPACDRSGRHVRAAAASPARSGRPRGGPAGSMPGAWQPACCYAAASPGCYAAIGAHRATNPHTFSAVPVTSQFFGGLLLSHTTTINYGALSAYITTERFCLSLIRYHTPQ